MVVVASVLPEVSELFAAHAPFASRLLRRFGVPDADVPDACQDVFVVVHRKLPDFDGRAAHRTWIFGICVRVAADYRKRAHRRYERLGDATAREVAEQAECVQPDRDLVRRAQRALAELDDDKRRVFVLHELEELTMPEVAAVLGCPLKTAFSRFYSARKALQDRLQSDRGRWGGLAWVGWGGGDPLSEELRAALDRAASLDPSSLLAPLPAAAASVSLLAPVVHMVAALAISVAVLQQRAPHGATLIAVTASSHRVALEPPSRTVPYLLAPRATAVVEPPAPTPKRSARSALAAEPVVRAPQNIEASAWLLAPERAVAPPPPPSAPSTRGADLDEVLSATSIRSSMRFGPSRESESTPWELVPQRGRQ